MHVRFSDKPSDNYKVQRIHSNETPRVENSIISRTYSDESVAAQTCINDRIKNFTSRNVMNSNCTFTDPDLSKEKFEKKRAQIIQLFAANDNRRGKQSLLQSPKSSTKAGKSYFPLSMEEIHALMRRYYLYVFGQSLNSQGSKKKKKAQIDDHILKLGDSSLNTVAFHDDREVYKSIPPEDFQFEEETIIRCFIPHDVILPEAIFFNNTLFNLDRFTGNREEIFREFFFTLLKEFNLPQYNEDTLKFAISELYESKILPPYLKNLLGISTISSRLLAIKLLDEIFPKLRAQFIYRCTEKVTIFYDVVQNQISCRQPIIITIYAKVDPENPDCFVKDEDRPLATATFIWRSYLGDGEEGRYEFSVLQFDDLNFIQGAKGLHATSSEKGAIKNALKAKKTIASPRIFNKIKV